MTIKRRGRPPFVRTADDGTITVNVKGTPITFKRDGRGTLRQVTKDVDAEDAAFARQQIIKQG